ncbi:MAG: DUF4870 domain-containing protein [Salibacteraceae bacterium]
MSPSPIDQPDSTDTLSSDSKTFGMLAHLAGLAGLVFPLGNIIGPLVIWVMKKETDPYVDWHGKQALNFQLSCLIYAVVAFVLAFFLIGFALIFAIFVTNIVLTIIAGVRANEGGFYEYPLSIRFFN